MFILGFIAFLSISLLYILFYIYILYKYMNVNYLAITQYNNTTTTTTIQLQSVQWHPTEDWLLATGAFEKTIGLIDARTATTTTACSLTADIESLIWDPFNPFHLYCAQEDGQIICIDVRNCANNSNSHINTSKNTSQKAIQFSFQAHDQTTSCISFSSRIPGMMATSSIDKTVKIWDTSNISSNNNLLQILLLLQQLCRTLVPQRWQSQKSQMRAGWTPILLLTLSRKQGKRRRIKIKPNKHILQYRSKVC